MPRGDVVSRLFSASLWVTAAKFGSLLAVLGVNMMLARMLTKEEFGTFFVFLSGIIIAGALARFGLKQTVVKVISEAKSTGQPGRARDAVAHILTIAIIGGVLVGLLSFYLLDFLASERFLGIPLLATLPIAFAMSVLMQSLMTPVASALKGFRAYSAASLLDDINPALPSIGLFLYVAVVWLSGGSLTLHDVVSAHVALFLVSLVFGIFVLGRKAIGLSGDGSMTMKELLVLSAPVYVVNVSTILLSEMSTWMAAYFAPADEVAVFGAALKLVKLVLIPLVVVNMVVAPFISELYSQNKREQLQSMLTGMTSFAAYPSLIVLLVFLAFGDQVLALVYGVGYATGWTLLALFAIGFMVNVWTGPALNTLIVTGGQKASMVLSIGAAIVMLVSGMVLGSLAGLAGVALAVTLGMTVQNLSAWYLVRMKSGISTNATWKITSSVKTARTFLASKARRNKVE